MPDEVDLIVTIQYHGEKAAQLAQIQNLHLQVVRFLKSDLDSEYLRIPHPKTTNVHIVPPDCIRFSWRTCPSKLLFNLVNDRGKNLSPEGKKNLSITSLNIEKRPVRLHSPYDASSRLPFPKPNLRWTNPDIMASRMQQQSPPRSPNCQKSHEMERDHDVDMEEQVLQFLNDTTQMAIQHQPEPSTSIPTTTSTPHDLPRSTTPQQSTTQAPVEIPPLVSETVASESDMRRVNTRHPLSNGNLPPSGSASVNNNNATRTTSEIEAIGRLTREFWDNRRQITAVEAKEKSIIRGLKTLGAPMPQVSSSLIEETNVEARLRMAELELEKERCKRVKAEEALKDVERECKEPFVVSALLDAFVGISQLTTEALTPGTSK